MPPLNRLKKPRTDFRMLPLEVFGEKQPDFPEDCLYIKEDMSLSCWLRYVNFLESSQIMYTASSIKYMYLLVYIWMIVAIKQYIMERVVVIHVLFYIKRSNLQAIQELMTKLLKHNPVTKD